MSLIVLGDWHNADLITQAKFLDPNTDNWWFPETGGCNLPALNDVLSAWGIAFSDEVVTGRMSWTGMQFDYSSGATLAKFPQDGIVMHAALTDQHASVMHDKNAHFSVPVMGLFQPSESSGRVAVLGDSGCLDDTPTPVHGARPTAPTFCADVIDMLLQYIETGNINAHVHTYMNHLRAPLSRSHLPARIAGSTLYLYSKVAADGTGQTRPLPQCTRASYLKPNTSWVAPRVPLGEPRFPPLEDWPVVTPQVVVPPPDVMSEERKILAAVCIVLIVMISMLAAYFFARLQRGRLERALRNEQ